MAAAHTGQRLCLAAHRARMHRGQQMHRPLLLQGVRGSGKSTLGRRLADFTGRPFDDLGERCRGGTRADQAHALAALLTASDANAPVVALGDDTLLDREARTAALDAAVVVTLDATPKTLSHRTGEPESTIRARAESTRVALWEAHGRMLTDAHPTDAIVREIEAVWRRDPIAVAAGDRSYCVDIGRGVVAQRMPELVARRTRLLLVTDDIVGPLHSARLDDALRPCKVPSNWLQLPHGEPHKRVASLELVWDEAFARGVDRKSCLVALGGGVLSDVAGFAAASWMRGIPWVVVPTTLLAMVDASVGGKTAVDFKSAKNAVGAFWQPSGVVCDVDFLSTEPARGYVSALAEVVKTAIIGDPSLFELLEANPSLVLARDPDLIVEMVRRSIRVKARIVSRDERESGLRAVLNLGHTLGHALEAQGNYERLSHGEAVGLGLVAALEIGHRIGLTPATLVDRTRRLLSALGLPCTLSAEPVREASHLIGHDKKRAGSKLAFVVARDLGRVETIPMDVGELEKCAQELTS